MITGLNDGLEGQVFFLVCLKWYQMGEMLAYDPLPVTVGDA